MNRTYLAWGFGCAVVVAYIAYKAGAFKPDYRLDPMVEKYINSKKFDYPGPMFPPPEPEWH